MASDIANHIGKEASLVGWAHRTRQLGAISFVLLRDRSGTAQLVLERKIELSSESIISATGVIIQSDKAPGGAELRVESIQIISEAAADLPLSVNKSLDSVGIEALLDHRVVSLRNPEVLDIFRAQSSIIDHFCRFLRECEFTEIKTSKLINTGTEGGAGLFEVSYFGKTVYLAQSPQFYKQAMVATGLERVFEVGAAYRAEKHETARHLNEYISLDVEMAFIDDELDLIHLEREILKAIMAGLERDCAAILNRRGVRLPSPQQLDAIPILDYEEARQIAREEKGGRVFEISPEAERAICLWARRNHGIDAAFVRNFPRRKRPFYTYPADSGTASFDLLYAGLEITTGGRRISDYQMLIDSMRRFKLSPDELADYLSIFKYGCPPHGGFAIGLERITQQILGLANVKEAALFPRDRNRTRP